MKRNKSTKSPWTKMLNFWRDGSYDLIRPKLTYGQDIRVQWWIFINHPRGLLFYIQVDIWHHDPELAYNACKDMHIDDVRDQIKPYGAYIDTITS